MYFLKGVNGQIELQKNRVVISRKGILGFAAQGLSGRKEIPIKNIQAVQFKDASSLTNGFIQFTIAGGREAGGGLLNATSDENTVLFLKKNQIHFENLKKYIDSVIDGEPLEFDTLDLEKSDEVLKSKNEFKPAPRNYTENGNTQKKWLTALVLSFIGLERFYLGKNMSAVLKLLTLGGIGIWYVVDIILILLNKTKDANNEELAK